MSETFDPAAREAQLRAESTSWDTSARFDAEPDDVPVVDVGRYFESGAPDDLAAVAAELNQACETVGFFQLVGHGLDQGQLDGCFAAVRQLVELPLDDKLAIRMDRPEHPLGGVGYLPLLSRKLPTRDRGNLNEAFVVKRMAGLSFDDSQWPDETLIPGFRRRVEAYAEAVTALALRLVPIYAVALGLDADYFDEAFSQPAWRLRMTRYPAPDELDLAGVPETEVGEYGIPPHVDTTFFTLLAQNTPGLTIYSHPRDCWLKVPVVPGAFVVNSGELLKQWTNDRYLSVRHFANNEGDTARYSIPFFFNAAGDYPMAPLPTCVSDTNPARYPTISYNESQAVAQGE